MEPAHMHTIQNDRTPLMNAGIVKANKRKLDSEESTEISSSNKISKYGIGTRTIKTFEAMNKKLLEWLFEPLENLGMNRKDIEEGILRIANAIFELEKEPCKFARRFSKNEDSFDGTIFKNPFAFHLKNSPEKEEMKLHIYMPSAIKGSFVGEGGCKKTKHSLTIIVPTNACKSITSTPLPLVKIIYSVIQRTLNFLPIMKIDQVYESLQLQEYLIKIIPPEDARLARNIDVRSYSSKNRKRLEIEQEWYNIDLHHAKIYGAVPININAASGFLSLRFATKVDLLIDQGKFLMVMHQQGIVHGDIKGANILLKITTDGLLKEDLTDCDAMQKIGHIPPDNTPYPYWDACRNNGFLLPSTDVQGFVYAIMEILSVYTDHGSKFSKYPAVESNEMVQKKLHIDMIIKSIKSFTDFENEIYEKLNKGSCSILLIDLLDTIEKAFQELQKISAWTAEQGQDINTAMNEILVFEKLISLLVRQKHSNQNLWKNLHSNVILQKIIQNGTLEEAQKAFDVLTSSTLDYLSINSVLEALIEIKSIVKI